MWALLRFVLGPLPGLVCGVVVLAFWMLVLSLVLCVCLVLRLEHWSLCCTISRLLCLIKLACTPIVMRYGTVGIPWDGHGTVGIPCKACGGHACSATTLDLGV